MALALFGAAGTPDVSQFWVSRLKAERARLAADVPKFSPSWLKAEHARLTADVSQIPASWLKAGPAASFTDVPHADGRLCCSMKRPSTKRVGVDANSRSLGLLLGHTAGRGAVGAQFGDEADHDR